MQGSVKLVNMKFLAGSVVIAAAFAMHRFSLNWFQLLMLVLPRRSYCCYYFLVPALSPSQNYVQVQWAIVLMWARRSCRVQLLDLLSFPMLRSTFLFAVNSGKMIWFVVRCPYYSNDFQCFTFVKMPCNNEFVWAASGWLLSAVCFEFCKIEFDDWIGCSVTSGYPNDVFCWFLNNGVLVSGFCPIFVFKSPNDCFKLPEIAMKEKKKAWKSKVFKNV